MATVLSERRDGVLLLSFNRPERMNAWTNAMEDEYFDRLEAAEADPGVRAIVVTGTGRAFCAGFDLDDLGAAGEIDDAAFARPRPRTLPLSMRKPLVAAINGAAAGLGLLQALYCDVRFCAPGAKLTTAFTRRGLTAEYGAGWLLPRIVGAWGPELLISGRVLRGTEAREIGLVHYLAEPEQLVEAAVAYAEDLARNCSAASIATIKRQLLESADQSFGESLAVADREALASLRQPDLAEGLASLLENRAPSFPELPPK